MERYAIRDGQEGHDRFPLLARERGPDTAALDDLGHFTADPRTLIAGPRVFQLWKRR